MATTPKTRFQKIKEISTPAQMFCLLITILLCGYFPVIFNNCVSYSRFRALEMPNYAYQKIEDFIWVIPFSIFIRVLKYTIHNVGYPFFKSKLHKYEGEELEMKIIKCTRATYKVVHFSFTFFFGWLMVLRKMHFFPPMMLGTGELMTTFSDWPYTQMPEYLKYYYMFSLSYYVEDLIMHMILPPNSDYFEMILHHLVTAMLIFSSYMNGFCNIGVFVLMQMDISDIFVGIIRMFIDFAAHWILFLIYV
mmetsp:Transcript_26203/g.30302  ORF Transcript_26203/g.30302 Transcript_26203/m.30302 type:complete len:249 (-) Transcript_26203:282-1028(-)